MNINLCYFKNLKDTKKGNKVKFIPGSAMLLRLGIENKVF
jgi:hypothetical protein